MIEINNLTDRRIDEQFLKKVAKKVLIGENKGRTGLSIVLSGPSKIRELNKKYRKKDKETDVLSFGESQKLKNKKQKIPVWPEIEPDFGEVIICLREVKKNAAKHGLNFKKELAKVLIHGILHLAGYDHEKKENEARKMEEKEEYYFKKLK